VEAAIREAIALFLDVSADNIDIEIKPEVPNEVDQARRARTALRRAEESAEQATRAAAELLIKQGYTVRDAGSLLGVSPQRISQITAGKLTRSADRAGDVGETKRAA